MIIKYKHANTHDRSDSPGRWGKCAALNVLFQMSELDPNGTRKQHLDRVELQENSMWITPDEGKGRVSVSSCVRKYPAKVY